MPSPSEELRRRSRVFQVGQMGNLPTGIATGIASLDLRSPSGLPTSYDVRPDLHLVRASGGMASERLSEPFPRACHAAIAGELLTAAAHGIASLNPVAFVCYVAMYSAV